MFQVIKLEIWKLVETNIRIFLGYHEHFNWLLIAMRCLYNYEILSNTRGIKFKKISTGMSTNYVTAVGDSRVQRGCNACPGSE